MLRFFLAASLLQDGNDAHNGIERVGFDAQSFMVLLQGLVHPSHLQQRVADYGDVSAQVGTEANNYLLFKPDDTTIFEITIECESMGMTRSVKAKAYLKDKDVRYVEWEEDPVGDRKESAK